MRFLTAALLRRRRALIAMLAWSLLEAAPAFASGRIVATALDDGFLRGRFVTGLVWLLVLGAITVCGAIGTRGMYPRLGDVVEPLRDELVTAVVGGALARACADDGSADRGPLGAAPVARLTRQVETVRDVVAGQLLVVRQFVATGIAVSLGLASLAAPLAALVVVPLALALLGFTLLLKPMIARQRAVFLAEEQVAALCGTAVEGLRDITAAGVERRIADGVGSVVEEQYRLSRALAGYGAARRAIVVFGGNVPMLLILLAARPLLRDGLTAGALVGALTYVTVNLEPALRTLVQGVGASALRLSVAIRRLAEGGLADSATTPDVPAPADTLAPTANPNTDRTPLAPAPALESTDLCFRYGPHADPVIADLALTIAPDEHLAIVGPSGSGKSTLLSLLAGLLQPESGSVRLLGRRLDSIAWSQLPELRVLIPQQSYVFAGSARENLAYLRPDATDTELTRAAERIGAGALLDRLGGLDALVAPALLSAAERQLIALVRAHLSRAPITMLDEATCYLDHAAERRAEAAFRDRPGALVLVAHRIGSARRADRVLLLDGSRTALGTHHELVLSSPQYAELVGHWDASVTLSTALRQASEQEVAP
jgi:ATP-binding cassette, subfamily B, bacterial RamB/AmfA